MDTSGHIVKLLAELLTQLEHDLEADTRLGPGWLAEEGEQVLARARQLSASMERGRHLPADTSVVEFLGQGWLECHEQAFELAANISAAIRGTSAA